MGRWLHVEEMGDLTTEGCGPLVWRALAGEPFTPQPVHRAADG